MSAGDPSPVLPLASEDAARAWLDGEIGGDGAVWRRLEVLVAMLAQENAAQNLVSAGSMAQVWLRHIADSAQLLRHVPRETTQMSGEARLGELGGESGPVWMDLGTGAGFPGLVIAAMRPQWRVRMVESRARRIDWLRRAVAAMDLPHAEVVGQRLELVPTQPADVISARAFAPLPELLSLSSRFSTRATCWLLPKGRSAAQELAKLSRRHNFRVESSVTDPEAGIIVGRLSATPGVNP
jgi:16S rRNA (guanine527-N7)-methyltransferase